MEGCELLVHDLVEAWAEPVHTVVDHLADSWMPGVVVRHHVEIALNVGDRVAVLHSMEWDDVTLLVWSNFAITNTKDEVASSLGVLHTIH